MLSVNAQPKLIERFFSLALFCLIFAGAASGPGFAARAFGQSNTSQSAAVSEAVRTSFGSAVEPVTGFKPYYVTGDFNGDAAQDLAIVVRIKEKRAALPKHVRLVNPFDTEAKVGFPSNPGGENKLALAIIHSWKMPQPAAKFLLIGESPILIMQYDRATSGHAEDAKGLIELMSKRGKRRRGVKFPPTAKGDVILMGTEVGGDSKLYWNGRKYVWEDSEED